jgi:hypothetical protein
MFLKNCLLFCTEEIPPLLFLFPLLVVIESRSPGMLNMYSTRELHPQLYTEEILILSRKYLWYNKFWHW